MTIKYFSFLILFAFFFQPYYCIGQNLDTTANLDSTSIKKNKLTFGISVGYFFSLPKIQKAAANQIPVEFRDSIIDISGRKKFSFGGSFFADYEINPHFFLRTELLIHGRKFDLYFDRPNNKTDSILIGQSYIGLPFYAIRVINWTSKLNSQIGFGPNIRYATRSKKIERMFDYSLDLFLGFGFIRTHKTYTTNSFFKLCYSFGLTNFIKTRDNMYNFAIGKLAIHTVSLSFGQK